MAELADALEKIADDWEPVSEAMGDEIKTMREAAAQLRALELEVEMLKADLEVGRILQMSDEEIRAEMVDEGLDPQEEVEKMRKIIREAIAKYREEPA